MQWPRSQSGKAKCAVRAAAGQLLPMPPPPGGNRCTTAEVTHVDGVVETKTGFPTKELALAWVGERLIVRPDTVSEGCSKP